jgi:hypothetical protein
VTSIPPLGFKRGAVSLGLPLGGCAEGIEGIALGFVGLAGLFVFLLFTLPPAFRYLDRRQHRERMRNRRPWSAGEAPEKTGEKPPRSRRRRA